MNRTFDKLNVNPYLYLLQKAKELVFKKFISWEKKNYVDFEFQPILNQIH